jgi:hypothetical protein
MAYVSIGYILVAQTSVFSVAFSVFLKKKF